MKLIKTLILAGAAGVAAPGGLAADPAVGFGVSFVFGGGQTDVALGLRVFSDDRSERAVASVGVDYVMKAQRVRPTLGVAYLKDKGYVGADLGFNFEARQLDYSIGLGVTDSQTPVAAVPGGAGGGTGTGGGGTGTGTGGGTDAVAKF